MSTYSFTISKRLKGSVSNPTRKFQSTDLSDFRKRDRDEITTYLFQKILVLEDNVDPSTEIIHHLLHRKRQTRFFKLIAKFNGDLDNPDQLQEFLPSVYKRYAVDQNQLKKQLCSLYEITSRYTVIKVELTVPCYGCRNDLPGQDDHMECNTGCLHDPTFCRSCL